jgi:hypothetical protein
VGALRTRQGYCEYSHLRCAAVCSCRPPPRPSVVPANLRWGTFEYSQWYSSVSTNTCSIQQCAHVIHRLDRRRRRRRRWCRRTCSLRRGGQRGRDARVCAREGGHAHAHERACCTPWSTVSTHMRHFGYSERTRTVNAHSYWALQLPAHVAVRRASLGTGSTRETVSTCMKSLSTARVCKMPSVLRTSSARGTVSRPRGNAFDAGRVPTLHDVPISRAPRCPAGYSEYPHAPAAYPERGRRPGR